MCGIVAVLNKYQNGFTQKQLDVFESLLYIDGLRGMDSTGVIQIDNAGKFLTLKGAVAPPAFLDADEWTTVRREAFQRGSALIGHNRKATKGSITDENAHPFVINDEFALVHNGTLMGDHRKYANVDVDSHAIAHYIHEHGVQKSVDELNAAYCFFWYDYRDKTVNLIRNKERPMFWMETDDAIYYASEYAFLDFVRCRHDLKLSKTGITEQPEFAWSTFKLEDKNWEIDAKTITRKVTPPIVTYNRNYPSKWSAIDDLNYSDYGTSDPVGTPVVNKQYNYSEIVAENSKIFSPLKDMETVLEASRKIEKAHGILVDWNLVNYSDHMEGYTLYFSSLDDEEPFLYTLNVSVATFTHVEEINRMVKEGVIYSLIPKTTRTYTKLNPGFGFVTIPCLTGQEISVCENTTTHGEANVH